LEYFRENHQQVMQQVRNEQEYLSWYVSNHQQLSYWPDHWCKSFKYHCNQRGLKSWLYPPEQPEDAKIIVFHGNPNPPDAIAGRSGKWYRKVLPTRWVEEHWV
ncbi:MAG: glycosyltransferase, partial [Planctomycetota bacterium]